MVRLAAGMGGNGLRVLISTAVEPTQINALRLRSSSEVEATSSGSYVANKNHSQYYAGRRPNLEATDGPRRAHDHNDGAEK